MKQTWREATGGDFFSPLRLQENPPNFIFKFTGANNFVFKFTGTNNFVFKFTGANNIREIYKAAGFKKKIEAVLDLQPVFPMAKQGGC